MKLLSLVAGLLIAGSSLGADFKVNTQTSSVKWYGSKVIGGSHDGTIKIKNGTLGWEKGKLTSAQITMDMTTIANSDISSEKYKKKLVNHLNSDDFFNVSKFKTSTFKSTKIQHVKDGVYMLRGDMTIKDKIKSVKFLAKLSKKGKVVSGRGEITIDRTDFDVKYGSGKFFDDLGDKMIADEIKIEFQLVTK